MKWLADENFPGAAVRALRDLGWDVAAATERHGGVADREIFEIVRREGRVLLTFDKDFGDLYCESPLIAPSGLILFRFRRPTSTDVDRRSTTHSRSADVRFRLVRQVLRRGARKAPRSFSASVMAQLSRAP